MTETEAESLRLWRIFSDLHIHSLSRWTDVLMVSEADTHRKRKETLDKGDLKSG